MLNYAVKSLMSKYAVMGLRIMTLLMFLLPRLQQNYDAKDRHYLTLDSTRKDTHAGV